MLSPAPCALVLFCFAWTLTSVTYSRLCHSVDNASYSMAAKALQTLRDHAQVKGDVSVLVIGGSGGCGALGLSRGKTTGLCSRLPSLKESKNMFFKGGGCNERLRF